MKTGLVLVAILVLSYSAGSQFVEGQSYGVMSITSYVAENPIVLDGRWTNPSEWKDSIEIKMIPSPWERFPGVSGTAYCRVKHDRNYLYVLVDFVSDTSPGSPKIQNYYSDFAGVLLYPQVRIGDAYGYFVAWEQGGSTYHGKVHMKNGIFDWDHTQRTTGVSSSSYEAKNSPYSTASHLIYEFKIPLAPGPDIRAYICCDDTRTRTHFSYPQNAWEGSWGTLRFLNETLRERRMEVSALLDQTEEKIALVDSSNPTSSKARLMLEYARQLYGAGLSAINASDFDSAEQYAQGAINSVAKVVSIEREYSNAKKMIDETRYSIEKAVAEERTMNLTKAKELLKEAESALNNDDYARSASLAEEAKLLAETSQKERWQGFLPPFVQVGSYVIYLIVASGASIAIPLAAKWYLRGRGLHTRTEGKVHKEYPRESPGLMAQTGMRRGLRAPMEKKRYEGYIEKLVSLREKGRINENTYLKLRREYEKKLEKHTQV